MSLNDLVGPHWRTDKPQIEDRLDRIRVAIEGIAGIVDDLVERVERLEEAGGHDQPA